MTNRSVLIGIAVETFLAGFGVGYTVFQVSNQPSVTMTQDPMVEANLARF